MLINKYAYTKLITEDIAWLLKQDKTLEREHIECVLTDSIARNYPGGIIKDSRRGGYCTRCNNHISRDWPSDDNIYESADGKLLCDTCYHNHYLKG